MNKLKIVSALFLFSTLAIFFSCATEDPFDPIAQLNSEIAAIDAKLGSTPNVVKHITGIRLVIEELGTDSLPASLYLEPLVSVKYTGKLFSDGSTFESSSFSKKKITGFISGWQLALAMLPVKSKATVYIPSYYAYGRSGNGNIPGNSTLIFDMDFRGLSVSSAQATRFKSDTTAIRAQIVKDNVSPTYDSAGIWYTITQAGDGPTAGHFDKVKIKYTYRKLTGEEISTFEQGPAEGTFDSRVCDYLNGIKAGLLNMNKGSKARLYVPSGLAFAEKNVLDKNGNTSIEPNTNLIIDIELQDIVQ